MKLELKHIAAYFPYNLEVLSTGVDLRFIVTKIETNQDKVYGKTTFGNNVPVGDMLNLVRPILRPLLDLTNEIEHNGKKFVPLDELTNGKTVSGNLNDYAEDWNQRTYYPFEEYVDEWIRGDSGYHLDFLPYGFIQKLLEWHFDVFNLREHNLCIYYNEL